MDCQKDENVGGMHARSVSNVNISRVATVDIPGLQSGYVDVLNAIQQTLGIFPFGILKGS